MAENTVVYTPDNMAGGWGNGLGGWGGGILGFRLGLFFGNGWGGVGGFGGGMNGGGAGFLSNQINNDSGRELLMNAINSNGEASRTAVQSLATMLGQDFNLVNAGVQTLQSALNTLAVQEAVSVPQIINAIQSGNMGMISKFSECCCNQKLLTVEQGYQSQIATLNQTNQLGSQADRNANSIINAINAQTVAMNDQFCAVKERELQGKIDTQSEIITQLRNQIDNANQTAQVAAMLAPINAKLVEIESRQPNTIPVQYPNVVAVNNTPFTGGVYGAGYGYGYGVPGGSYWG